METVGWLGGVLDVDDGELVEEILDEDGGELGCVRELDGADELDDTPGRHWK